jgi:serine/threonine protein phosphatase PrpC
MAAECAARPALVAAGASDCGRVRRRNEDRFSCDPASGIFVVVDGVGGHPAGERAAELALEAVRVRLKRGTGTVPERLREAIASANEHIHDEARARADVAGMSCVLTAVVVEGARVYAGHVGDTRLYKLQHGAIVKLTHDHSPVGALEDSGTLGELQAMRHPRRNEVWRDVGTAGHHPDDSDFIDVVEDTFEPDAALVVCSDGLSDLLSSASIASIVYRHAGDPSAAVRDLIDAANKAGGPDNVTAIVVEGPAFGQITTPPRSRARRTTAALIGYSVSCALAAATAVVVIAAAHERLRVRDLPPIPAPVLYARTWIVGAGPAADAATIGAAIERAQPGDMVLVEQGTYRESIVLKAGVAVVSATRRRAELRRPAGQEGPWTAVSAIGIASGLVRGFRIVGTEAEPLDIGIQIHDAVARIEDVLVVGARDSAIDVSGGATPVIHSCELRDNPGGHLRIRGGAAPVLMWNVIDAAEDDDGAAANQASLP